MDTTVADPLIGQLLDGRYRIRGRIATGGMATVYHATDERLERVVAVKVIHPTYAGNPSFLSRFDREAKTIAALTHPNVVSVYDTGQHGNLPYLVMEYVRGRTLRDVLAQRGRVAVGEALAITESMLAALAAAHRAGLVHRDVKPENILIGESDATGGSAPVVKVADFGLARAVESSADDATAGGQLMATVAYVPPELVQSAHSDARSDVYSAGIVLFEMLTGDVPFHGRQAVDVAYQHVEHDVPAPSRFIAELPPALDELVVRATRRDPGARPTDAGAFLAELRATREDIGLLPAGMPAPPVRAPQRPPALARTQLVRQLPAERRRPAGTARRHRAGLIGAAIVLALGLVAGIGGWWLGAGRYTDAPSVLKLSQAQAETKVKQAGFHLRWGPQQYSDTVPKGAVFGQQPQPGQRIVRGGTLTVELSKGPMTVPSLAGMGVKAATDTLDAMGLKTTTSRQYSSSVAKDKVISANPKPGTVVHAGDTVQLAVSKGPAPVTVPDVRGMDVEDATTKLEDNNLTVGTTQQQSDQKKGTVIGQTPAPGSGAGRGDQVTLTVSSGPPQVTVPDVTRQKLKDARKTLQDAGFKVQVMGLVTRDESTVYAQNPTGDARADKGSTITLWVI
jgi:serine/threonine-protein kinase